LTCLFVCISQANVSRDGSTSWRRPKSLAEVARVVEDVKPADLRLLAGANHGCRPTRTLIYLHHACHVESHIPFLPSDDCSQSSVIEGFRINCAQI